MKGVIKLRKKFRVLFGSILIIVSIGCFCYPQYHQRMIEKEADSIEKELSFPSTKEESEEALKMEEEEKKYEKLYKEMESYNQRLESNGQNLVDVWSYEEPPMLMHFMPDKDNVAGTIEIPDMQVKLPLYLGASKDHLSKGAGILSETSMPIGGENTNCVIAAHRGWRGTPYFQHIEKMSAGSLVYIKNLWEVRVYQAVEVKIIEPWDLNSILIQEGKDMVTLLTCHPYGVGGGTHRYIVYCEYVETQSAIGNRNSEKNNVVDSVTTEINKVDKSEKIMEREEKIRVILPVITFIIIIFRFFNNLRLDKRNKNSYNTDINN